MIRELHSEMCEYSDTTYRKFVVLTGLSTDTKPTEGLATGSMFIEADTWNVYIFDETGAGTWYND